MYKISAEVITITFHSYMQTLVNLKVFKSLCVLFLIINISTSFYGILKVNNYKHGSDVKLWGYNQHNGTHSEEQEGTQRTKYNTRAHPRDLHMKITATTNSSSFLIKY
jgi:hypothetical protein